MLQWLRLPGKPEGQCDWHANTCVAAAEGGHLEMLKWLRSGDDPCPWSLSMCKEVAITAEIVVWIESQAKAGVESDCDDEFDESVDESPDDEFEHDWDDDDEFDSDDDDSDEVG